MESAGLVDDQLASINNADEPCTCIAVDVVQCCPIKPTDNQNASRQDADVTKNEDECDTTKLVTATNVSTCNYEEPWSLSATQNLLADCLRTAHQHLLQHRACIPTAMLSGISPDSGLLWKQQGVGMDSGNDRPPDVKPHNIDVRPSAEYDEPWDKKAKDIERSLINAKVAKEAAKAQWKNRCTVQCAACLDQGIVIDVTSSPHRHTACIAGSDVPAKCCSTSPTTLSPKRKWNLYTSCVPEHVDPNIPLHLQGWFHGAISRVEAEALLRVHREGSYLVRTSESNAQHYSLSLKSCQGFLHMKIVCGDGGAGSKYILGQFSQPFDSIPQMIHFYTINKLPIKGAEHMSLMHPVNHDTL